MGDDDRKRDADANILPAQIPLLEDVVEVKPKPRPRRKKKRDNYTLDLDPAPPRSMDLFAEPELEPSPEFLTESGPGHSPPDDREPVPLDQAEPQLSGTELDTSPDTLNDTSADEVALPAPLEDDVEEDDVDEDAPSDDILAEYFTGSVERETELRARADTVVDHLVKEYSKEIIERLRKELTTLLDELDRDADTDS